MIQETHQINLFIVFNLTAFFTLLVFGNQTVFPKLSFMKLQFLVKCLRFSSGSVCHATSEGKCFFLFNLIFLRCNFIPFLTMYVGESIFTVEHNCL